MTSIMSPAEPAEQLIECADRRLLRAPPSSVALDTCRQRDGREEAARMHDRDSCGGSGGVVRQQVSRQVNRENTPRAWYVADA
jgi:hypothetical protein